MGKKLRTGLVEKKTRMKLFSTDEIIGTLGSSIILFGNREVSVEGCRGVVDYYDNLIRLKVQDGTAVFNGQNLEIVSMTDETAVIKGVIGSVELDMRVEK